MGKIAPLQRPETLKDSSINAVRAAILEGVYLPGQRIVESTVAKELGISRAPLREALSSLAEEGFVESDAARRGYKVPELSEKIVLDLYAIRTAMEIFAFECLWDRRTPEFFATLQQRHEELAAAIAEESQSRAIAMELAFHRTVYEFCGNEILLDFYRLSSSKLQLYWSAQQRINKRYGPKSDAHTGYLACAAGDDIEALRAEIRDHMKRGQQVLLDQLSNMLELPS